MGTIETIRSFFADSFLTLPILLASFVFVYGLLTSNVGLLVLGQSHLLLVPMFLFHSNETSPFWDMTRIDTMFYCLKWVVSAIVMFTVSIAGLVLVTGSNYSYTAYIVVGVSALLQFLAKWFGKPISMMNIINPVWWLKVFNVGGLDKLNISPVPSCSVIGHTGNPRDTYATPSSWIAHICFFYGFLLANAYEIYYEPPPKLVPSNDPNVDKKKQTILDGRVSNRKWLVSGIIVFAICMFLFLVFMRYMATPCEYPIYLMLFPMIYSSFLGVSVFYILFKLCGVTPTDILGLVQGMIPADLNNNPVVCIASDKKISYASPVGPSGTIESTNSSKASSGSSFAYSPSFESESAYIFGPLNTFLGNKSSQTNAAKGPSGPPIVTMNAPVGSSGPSVVVGPSGSSGPSVV
jgi:hypothetical protein